MLNVIIWLKDDYYAREKDLVVLGAHERERSRDEVYQGGF